MLRRRACGYAALVHSEMPTPGVPDFRLIAPLQFKNYHARARWTPRIHLCGQRSRAPDEVIE
jgi:hypothetical protein